MARSRSLSPARRSGIPPLLGVLLPLALTVALIVGAVAMLSAGGGKKATEGELDTRAATVKQTWDAAGRPPRPAQLAPLGRRVDAQLSVVRRQRPADPTTSGDFRHYRFAARGG